MAKATVLTVTIPAGQSLSNSADLTVASLAAICFPPEWTSANMSFQTSADNVNFFDLYDNQGMEVQRTVGPARAVLTDIALTQAALYLKLRSGSANNPVPQDVDSVIKLVLL